MSLTIVLPSGPLACYWSDFMECIPDSRYLLSAENFQWKKHIPIAEKTILLVDDIVGTGATLRASAQRLYEGFPLKVIKMGCVVSSVAQEVSAELHPGG
jgi:adenine/guanine phosphoribosyltransferase-like PRPP-binding protein